MTIQSVTSSGAVSQAAWVSQVQNHAGAGSAGAVHRPPPPPDGGGLVGAIADALQSIGVTATGAADGGSATDSADKTAGQGNAAQALGSFLHELMGALHEQGAPAQGSGQGGQPPDGQSYGPPGGGYGSHGGPAGAGGPGGGPGRLAADLHSLIARLGSNEVANTGSASSADSTGSTSSTSSTSGTDSTGSISGTDSTAGTASSAATASHSSALESAFTNLLQALGTDASDAGGKLASFLQTLADKLPTASSSGNLVNTSV